MSHQPATKSRRSVEIAADGVRLAGDLVVSSGARGVVVFAHGSGSGRVSPRNRAVAGVLNAGGLATLLLDLLTPEEKAVDRADGAPALRRHCADAAHRRGNDIEVLRLNELARAALAGEARLEVVPGAGHLFEEPGALERVAVLSRDWFRRHLTALTAEQPRRSRSALDEAAP
jgi:hypothetical protein